MPITTEKYMHKTILASMLAAALVSCAVAPVAASGLNEYATVPGSQCRIAGVNGGDANHQFATQAIGSANRSTTSGVFVICPFLLTPTPAEGGVVTEMNLSAYTADGQPHSMTCTAVIGSLNRPIQPTYSPKTITVAGSSAENPTVFTWTPDDFNGASPTGGIVGSAWGTITCLLPPQTAIALMYAKLNGSIQ